MKKRWAEKRREIEKIIGKTTIIYYEGPDPEVWVRTSYEPAPVGEWYKATTRGREEREVGSVLASHLARKLIWEGGQLRWGPEFSRKQLKKILG